MGCDSARILAGQPGWYLIMQPVCAAMAVSDPLSSDSMTYISEPSFFPFNHRINISKKKMKGILGFFFGDYEGLRMCQKSAYSQGLIKVCCHYKINFEEVNKHAVDLFGSELSWTLFSLSSILSFYSVICFSPYLDSKDW